MPRSIDCVMANSLHSLCNAGDAVTICGVVKVKTLDLKAIVPFMIFVVWQVHRESSGFGATDQQLHQFYIDVVAVRNHKDADRTMGGNWFTFSNKDYYAVKVSLLIDLVKSICSYSVRFD